MNKKEAAKIVGVLVGYYPDTFKSISDEQMQMFVEIWQKSFEDNTYEEVSLAVWDYIQNSTDNFMPRVGRIKSIMSEHEFESVPNEMEAFEILIKARQRYNIYAPISSEDSYGTLPEPIQNAIGGRKGFISIGLLNTETESFSIEKTHFMQQYKREIEKTKRKANRPKWLNQAIARNMLNRLGSEEKLKEITDGK